MVWAFAKQRCMPGFDVQESRGQNRVQIHGLPLPKPNGRQIFQPTGAAEKWSEIALYWT